MSSLFPSSSPQINANIPVGNGTLQRSTVNNAAADALRKKNKCNNYEMNLKWLKMI